MGLNERAAYNYISHETIMGDIAIDQFTACVQGDTRRVDSLFAACVRPEIVSERVGLIFID